MKAEGPAPRTPPAGAVHLVPLTAQGFDRYLEHAIPAYARDKVSAGNWAESESLALARREVERLLPQGHATPGHHLYAIHHDDEADAVGMVWIAEQDRTDRRVAYVYDVWIGEPHRRKGYARQAFGALEQQVQALGLAGIALHVFGHNTAARALYAGLGYQATNINMFKEMPVPTLAARIRRSARVTGHFVLRSGLASDTYFDKYQFESDPQLLLAIAREMARLVPPGTEVLAGLEMGGIPIVTLLSQVTGLPAAFIRKEAKAYGTCRYAEGASLAGRRFVLVEDVVSSGGALVDALAKLQADGLVPEAALCVIDRQTGGSEALARHGLPLKAMYTFDEIERA